MAGRPENEQIVIWQLQAESPQMSKVVKERKKRTRSRPDAVTLKDVAAVANVSEVTVSRIVRNSGYIGVKTRERVQEAIREVGYLPNRIAGTLASAASSNLVGVIVPSLSNIVFPEVLQGIHEACNSAGLQPVVGVSGYDVDAEEKLICSLLAWQPKALLVTGVDHTDEARRQLEYSKVRVAQLMDTDTVPIDVAVGFSHVMAGYDSAKHLIGRGYRRIGYVGHDAVADKRARQRHKGICRALTESGLSLVDEKRFDGPSSVAAGKAMLAELLEQTPSIDAVIFSNDDMAIGGVFHCMANGIVLKDQLGVFGFNGLEIGQSLPVVLSTLRSNRFMIGKLAIEKILEQQDRPAEPVKIDSGYEIIDGATA